MDNPLGITDSSQIISIGYTHVDIFEIEQILIWAETHFREPRINVLTGVGLVKEPPEFPHLVIVADNF